MRIYCHRVRSRPSLDGKKERKKAKAGQSTGIGIGIGVDIGKAQMTYEGPEVRADGNQRLPFAADAIP